VLEKDADRLAVMNTTDSLSKNGRDIEYLKLRAKTTMLVLRNRVGYKHLVNGRSIDASDSVATEDTVGDEGIDLSSALLLQKLRSTRDRVTSIDNVVN
jgi:hypothetical protein